MLEQQQHVADAVLLAQRDQLFLQAQGFGVGDAAEIEVLNHRFFDCSQSRAGESAEAMSPLSAKCGETMGQLLEPVS